MKILSKYVLREHVGPLTFALTALTSIMLLNFISRQFGELVGKGLPWQVIAEFFVLAIPFTVALTVPMSVLVAVLYAYSRLAAENEVTALKASGVSPWRLVSPALAGGIIWSFGLLAFNDQVLPRANHRLKVLQEDISQAKPTFLLKEQVINTIAEGKLYLQANKIDRADSGKMKQVVIYDLADPMQRRTIYADSGTVSFASNGRDLDLDLFHGQMQQVSTDKPGQLTRLFYDHDRIHVRDVGTGDFKTSPGTESAKGDREMSVCEMQQRLTVAQAGYLMAKRDYDQVKATPSQVVPEVMSAGPPVARRLEESRGIGWAYCKLVSTVFGVKPLGAAELPPRRSMRADTIPAGDTAARRDSAARTDSAVARVRAGMRSRLLLPSPAARPLLGTTQLPPAAAPPAGATVLPPPVTVIPRSRDSLDAANMAFQARLAEAKLRLDLATRSRNRYAIEIHKKFSLAAACFIFVIVGAPIAVRFPRGGVGLVIGVSLVVFALYYVGLIGGEALANEGKLPPFWAMWGTNVIMTMVGIVMLLRMGNDQNTGRGGGWLDRVDRMRMRFRRRGPGLARGESL